MKSLFVNTSIENPNVTDVGFTKSYEEIEANSLWSEYEGYALDAARFTILPYIGRPLYDDISAKIEAEEVPEARTEFVTILRRAVAYHAVVLAYPKKYTVLSSAGAGQNQSGKFINAPLAAYKISLWDITKTADRHLDTLLEFLENQEYAYFDLWKNDPAYTRGTTPFFRKTADFQRYFNIFSSRSTFLSLNSHINDICEDVITPILCDNLFVELANAVAKNDISEANAKLLHLIRRAVAPLAVAKAIPYLAVLVESDGFKIVSSTDSMDKRDTPMKQHQALVQSLADRCTADGTKALNVLKKYIVNNADKFAAYKDSSCHKAAISRTARFGVEVLTDNRDGSNRQNCKCFGNCNNSCRGRGGFGGTGAFIFRRK